MTCTRTRGVLHPTATTTSTTHASLVDGRPAEALELLALLEHPGLGALPGVARVRLADVAQLHLGSGGLDAGLGEVNSARGALGGE
jgi:hypothetical protein